MTDVDVVEADRLRELIKDAYLAGFAAARRGNAEAAWEDSITRMRLDYPKAYSRPQ